MIYDSAPDALRYGVREVLRVLGYTKPSQQRRILCGALRISPENSNWSEYPNIDAEVIDLLVTGPWYKFFDALERIPLHFDHEYGLSSYMASTYYEMINSLFAEERIGYRFDSELIVRVGTEEFHALVAEAKNTLRDERFVEVHRQFTRAYEFRNQRPPDWANTIKEAVNSVEAILQVVYDRPGVALTTIISQGLPPELPGGIKRLFRCLYSHGSGTVGARHASIGGNEPTGPRAELAIHVAAALHTFAAVELYTSQ